MGLLIRFARQWVAGDSMGDAMRTARDANRRGMGAILNLLGEHYEERSLVEGAMREYVAVLEAVHDRKVDACLSIKPTQTGVAIDVDYYWQNVATLLERVQAMGAFLWFDMESSRFTDATLDVYRRALARYSEVGVAVQSNLRRTERDVESLLDVGGIVRLVKGAYREAPPVGTANRRETDANYHRILDLLFDRGDRFAVGTHDSAMIDHALERQRKRSRRFEFQMLLGVREPLKHELVRSGHRVGEYIPYGPNWLPYFTRRLRERPRNLLTMARSFVSG